MRVSQTGDFRVDTRNAGSGELKVTVRGPKGLEEPLKQVSSQDGVFSYEYYPKNTGKYSVSITWGGQPIPKSPFEVSVGPEPGPQQIRAWGPGLEGGTVGKPAAFVVESIGTDVGVLGFAIEGPSQAKIECEDQNDGSCDVRYWPMEPGEYAVHVTCDEEDIELSPFMAIIVPDDNSSHADKVQAYGPGLEKSGCLINKPAEFTVNAKDAGKGPLKISAQDSEGKPIDVKVVSKGDGLYSCSYTPTSAFKHTVSVSWAGVSVPNSPFRVSSRGRPSQTSSKLLFNSKNITLKYREETSKVVQSKTSVEIQKVVQSEPSVEIKKTGVVQSKPPVTDEDFVTVLAKRTEVSEKRKRPVIVITTSVEERFC